MRKEKNIFKEQKTHQNGNFKYFILAFSLFIIIVAIFSTFLLLRSLDFDINNLVAGRTESTTDETLSQKPLYSVSSLSGKSNIIFICVDNKNEFKFSLTLKTDYDNKLMTVNSFGYSDTVIYDGQEYSCGVVYERFALDALIKSISVKSGTEFEKYIKCTSSQLKDVFSLFKEINVNVLYDVDYHSPDFNLELDSGKQNLSADYLMKYLMISENSIRKSVFCDIINSVLKPEYTENSYNLFIGFVNSCETDISVIDYSESIEKLIVYSNSDDKFLPDAE